MKLSFKKTLALLLSVLMVVGCMSVTAFADGEAAEVNGTSYASFTDALNAAKAAPGSTLKLLKDSSTAISISGSDINFTLDLNGYNIKTAARPISVYGGANLIIINSNTTYTANNSEHNAVIDTRSSGEGSILAKDAGTKVFVHAGYYEGFNGNKTAIHIYSGAELFFYDGTVYGAPKNEGAGYIVGKEGKIFYSGGETKYSWDSFYAASGTSYPGKVHVYGGTFTGRFSNSNWGSYDIRGGTFDRFYVVDYDNPVDENGKPTWISLEKGMVHTESVKDQDGNELAANDPRRDLTAYPGAVTFTDATCYDSFDPITNKVGNVVNWIPDGFSVYKTAAGYTVAADNSAPITVVAESNGVKFATFAEAVADSNGESIKLLADTTLTANITNRLIVPAGKTLTLDLKGYTVSGALDPVIINSGNLTIKDTATGGKIQGTSCIRVATGSTTTIKSGIFEGGDGCIWSGNATDYTVNIEGGELSATENAILMGNGNAGNGVGATWNVSGGTFTGSMAQDGQDHGYIACGIYAPDSATWNITGGTFNITRGVGIVARAGAVNIPDNSTVSITTTGDVTGKVGDSNIVVPCAALVFDSRAGYPQKTASDKFTVEAGTFASQAGIDTVVFVNADADTNTRISITGGTFSSEPTGFIADGYAAYPVAGGKYTVAEAGAPEAKIGDVEYLTLKDAIEAANPSDKITILRDFTIDASKTARSDRINIETPVTIDFGAYTMYVPGELEPTDNWAALYIRANTTVKGTTGGICCLDKVGAVEDKTGVYTFQVQNNSTLTVNSGVYYAGGSIITVHEGTAYVNGGSFGFTPYDEPYNSDFALNCIDANYNNGTAKLIVRGGTFNGFNPADNKAEGTHTNFVDSGYKAVKVLDTWVVGPGTPQAHATTDVTVEKVNAQLTDDEGNTTPVVATTVAAGTGTNATEVIETKVGDAEPTYTFTKGDAELTVNLTTSVVATGDAEVAAALAKVISAADTSSGTINAEVKVSATDVTGTALPSYVDTAAGKQIYDINLVVAVGATEETVQNAKNGKYTVSIDLGPEAAGKKINIRHHASDGLSHDDLVAIANGAGVVTFEVSHFSYVETLAGLQAYAWVDLDNDTVVDDDELYTSWATAFAAGVTNDKTVVLYADDPAYAGGYNLPTNGSVTIDATEFVAAGGSLESIHIGYQSGQYIIKTPVTTDVVTYTAKATPAFTLYNGGEPVLNNSGIAQSVAIDVYIKTAVDNDDAIRGFDFVVPAGFDATFTPDAAFASAYTVMSGNHISLVSDADIPVDTSGTKLGILTINFTAAQATGLTGSSQSIAMTSATASLNAVEATDVSLAADARSVVVYHAYKVTLNAKKYNTTDDATGCFVDFDPTDPSATTTFAYIKSGTSVTVKVDTTAATSPYVYKTMEENTTMYIADLDATAKTFTVPEYDTVVNVFFALNKYTVEFDSNKPAGWTGYDVAGTMADQEIDCDVATPLTANAFSLTGYSFAGWATVANGAKVYNDADAVTNLALPGETITLYAVWTPVYHSVTLASDNTTWPGSVKTAGNPFNVQEGAKISTVKDAVALNAMAADNYKIVSWAFGGDTGKTSAQLADAVVMTDMTATATTAKIFAVTSASTFTADLENEAYSNQTAYSSVGALDGYNADYYTYVVTVSGGAITLSSADDDVTFVNGVVGFDATAFASLDAGATLTITVTPSIKITVEAFPLNNNVALIRAYFDSAVAGAGKTLVYGGSVMRTDANLNVDGHGNAFIMAVDTTKLGLATINMANVAAQVKLGITAVNTDTITPAALTRSYDVNSTGGVTISDLTLTYNVYMGTYSYGASVANGGRLSIHEEQYLLADATFNASIIAGTKALDNLSDPSVQSQLVTMEDVKTLYANYG